VAEANLRGSPRWRSEGAPLRSSPLELRDLGAVLWEVAVRALLAIDDPTAEVRAHNNSSAQQVGARITSLGAQDLRPDDPFLRWHSAAKCAEQAHRPPPSHLLAYYYIHLRTGSILLIEQVYIGSNESATVPRGAPPGVRGPLRKCKLAVLCAMLHVEDEPYARCIQGAAAA